MESAEILNTLAELPIGGRLLFRSRTTWRAAYVVRVTDDGVVLSVCSPTGRNYRLRRPLTTAVELDGPIPVLSGDIIEPWRDNFACYDSRW